MSASGSLLWPTARAREFAQTAENPTPGQTGGTSLAGAAERFADRLWTTAQAHDVSPRGRGQVASAAAGNRCLARDAENWSTVRGSDGEKGGPNMSFGSGGTPLPAQAANWATPAARDAKGENAAAHLTNGTGRKHMDQLPNQVAHGFPHPGPMTTPHGVPSSAWRPISRRLLRSAISSVEPTTWRRWLRKGAWRKRRLNPIFTAWLMRWPGGLALCACSETELILWRQDMRGALSALPTASAPWIWKPPAETAPVAVQGDMFEVKS